MFGSLMVAMMVATSPVQHTQTTQTKPKKVVVAKVKQQPKVVVAKADIEQ